MSALHNSTEVESTIKDDKKDQKYMSSSKNKRYRSHNPQSSKKLKELIARKKAARKRNKNFNKPYSSKVYYIQNKSKSTSYDQIKALSNQKKIQETEKENETETKPQSHSDTHEATENTNDTLFSFTSSEIKLSEVFQSVLESISRSNSYSKSSESKINSNSHDTSASMEETENEEADIDENPADESNCCQCWWIISILGTIILLAVFGPNIYKEMNQVDGVEMNKNQPQKLKQLELQTPIPKVEDWKTKIDQSFAAYENKKTFKNMKEFNEMRSSYFGRDKFDETNDQDQYLKKKRRELFESRKAIPSSLVFNSTLHDSFEIIDFDEETKKPVYSSEKHSVSSGIILFKYYKDLWSIVDSQNKVLYRWESSENIDHPGLLDPTKNPAVQIDYITKEDSIVTKEIKLPNDWRWELCIFYW